jgi:DNA-binding transcriptional MerR regulator
MTYTVKQLAKLAGVSVRTLHYYHQIGLLKPAFIHDNGYRYYQEPELLKLEQIRFFKELELPLETIVKILMASDFDTAQALLDQKRFLELKQTHLASLLQTIETTIATLKGGEKIMKPTSTLSMTQQQIDEFKSEAKQRWGKTDAYKQSEERTRHWTKADYQQATEGWGKFNQKLADTMGKGFDSPEFQALIFEQHQNVNTFYDCSVEMFRSLGNMYATDPKFKQSYDSFKPGLANVMQQAVNYYCDHQSK